MGKKKYNYNTGDGVWRTIGGRKVFIKNGQSLSDAMKESGKFKKASDVKRYEYQKANAENEYDQSLHNEFEAERWKERFDGRTQEGKEATKKYREARQKEKEAWNKREAYYVEPEEYKGGVAGIKGKHVEPNMKADLKKTSWREYFNNDESYSEHDIQSYELNGNYLLKKPYDVGVGYNWQIRTDGENRGVSFAIERSKYNQMEKDGTLIPVKNFQEGVEKLRGLPAKNIDKGTKDLSEAEKYYSKLSQYQAREDLDMRKSWLDDNVYAPDKRKEYEDFYKQGEKYYQEKYEKPKFKVKEEDAINNSYWNGNGKYGEYANYLTGKDDDDLINQRGIPKKLVDEYHQEGRRYYRWFNDGVIPHKKTLDGRFTYSTYMYKLPYDNDDRKYWENIYTRDMDARMDKIFEKMQDAEIKTGFEVGQINKPMMLRYGDTIDYLKSTTNMNTSQILEILKQMDANR